MSTCNAIVGKFLMVEVANQSIGRLTRSVRPHTIATSGLSQQVENALAADRLKPTGALAVILRGAPRPIWILGP